MLHFKISKAYGEDKQYLTWKDIYLQNVHLQHIIAQKVRSRLELIENI